MDYRMKLLCWTGMARWAKTARKVGIALVLLAAATFLWSVPLAHAYDMLSLETSSTETTTAPMPPSAVATPKINAFTPFKDSVTLEWKTAAGIEYSVEVKAPGGNYWIAMPYRLGIGSFTVSGLKTNTPYTFRVRGRQTAAGVTVYSKYSAAQIVRTGPKITIYLTFDDGPSKKSTPKILDILSSNNIKATFFMLGSQALGNKAVAKRVVAQGHAIANHGYSHNYKAIYRSPQAFASDIAKSERAIKQATGKKPSKVVRFPGGSTMGILQRNGGTFRAIKGNLSRRGYQYFDWDVSLADSRTKAPKKGALSGYAIKQIKAKVKAGRQNIVVLAHDTNSRPWTPQEIPRVIKYCQSQGFYFKTLDVKSPPSKFR